MTKTELIACYRTSDTKFDPFGYRFNKFNKIFYLYLINDSPRKQFQTIYIRIFVYDDLIRLNRSNVSFNRPQHQKILCRNGLFIIIGDQSTRIFYQKGN